MSKHPTLRAVAIVLAVAALSFTGPQVTAATPILVSAGTQVGLTLLDPVDATTATVGTKVHFKVTAPVIVNRLVVIERDTPVTGIVNKVKKPGGVLNDASVNISYLSVIAVDHKPMVLNDVDVAKAVFGGNVKMEAGHVVVATTKNAVTVQAP